MAGSICSRYCLLVLSCSLIIFCYLLFRLSELFPDSLTARLPEIRREKDQRNNETLALADQPRFQQYRLWCQPLQLQEWGSWVSVDFLAAFSDKSSSSTLSSCRSSSPVASRRNVVLLLNPTPRAVAASCSLSLGFASAI